MKSGLILFLCALSAHLFGQEHLAYIEAYRDIAVSEMHRTGIPASIKLAQAILESSGGQSNLARRANNHFGMKCGSEWGGKKMYRKDDDRNHRGRLIESCFRVFDSGEESFIAHSEFLRDPKKSYRYGFLFDLKQDDYQGWAKGLKKAGYATNPRYPQLLIKLIEDYGLYEYDKEPVEALFVSNRYNGKDYDRSQGRQHLGSTDSSVKKSYAIQYHNDVKYVLAYAGDNVSRISRSVDVPVWRLIRYNETIDDPHQSLDADSKVYLQPKRHKYRGDQQYHVVKANESMDEIAQHYGMLLKSLYRRNNLAEGSQPAIGEILVLRGKTNRAVALRSEQTPVIEKVSPQLQPGIFLDEISAPVTADHAIPAEQMSVERSSKDQESASGQQPPPPSVVDGLLPDPGYTVQQSDTLYQIARLHGLTVSDLKKINNLQGDTIHPGQVLKVSE